MTPPETRSKLVRDRWEDVDWEPIGKGNLLPDGPDDPPGIETLFEQERIGEEIKNTIAEFLARLKDDGKDKRTLILALHGRLGQGKTRVISKVVAQLDEKMRVSRRWRVPLRVFRFNCSDYLPEDLLRNFDHFLENGRTFRIAAVSAILAGFVIWIFFRLPAFSGAITAEIGVSAALVSALLAGLAPMRHLLRDIWRDIRIGKPFGKTARKVFDRLFIPWDLLVIDDLDRATVDQQRALLHSLNRHRGDMSGVVLVAFDDAALLSRETVRTESSEILTKVFSVSFRLSPLNANDAGAMAAAFGPELRRLNPECKVAKAFGEPIVCGALARIFLLHGNASARFAKKLINNVYSAALLGRFSHEADLVSLIRLHGVYQYLPVLETELDFLGKAMLESTEDHLFETIRTRFGDDLGIQLQTQIRNMLKATHHMQPTNLGWLRTLRIWRDAPVTQSENAKSPEGWQDSWTRNWAINEAYLTRMENPRERQRGYDRMRKDPLHALASREITPPPQEDQTTDFDPSKEDSQGFQDYWQAMVDGLMVFDSEVLEFLTRSDLAKLLERHRLRPLATLLFSHSEEAKLGPPHVVFRHSLFATDTNLEDRLRHELGRWTGPIVARNAPTFPNLSAAGLDRFSPSFLENSWPDFTSEPASKDFTKVGNDHFRELGLILYDLPRDTAVFPLAHLDWIRAAVEAERFDAIRKAMHLLHEPSRARQPFWHVAAQKAFWERTGNGLGFHANFISHLCRAITYDSPKFTDLWMLSVLGEASLQSFALQLPAGPDLFLALLPDQDLSASVAPAWYGEMSDLAACHKPVENALVSWMRAHDIRYP